MSESIPSQCKTEEQLVEPVSKKKYLTPELIDLDSMASTEGKGATNPTEASPGTGPS